MSVYFMHPIGGGPIKIGFSKDVESRRKTLEGNYGRPLEVLAVIEGDRKTEARIHKQFAHLRLAKTEQFRPGDDLMAFIGIPALAGASPEDVEVMPSKHPQFNYRLPPEATDAIAVIREHYYLPSDTSAVAIALLREAEQVKAEQAKAARRLA